MIWDFPGGSVVKHSPEKLISFPAETEIHPDFNPCLVCSGLRRLQDTAPRPRRLG